MHSTTGDVAVTQPKGWISPCAAASR